MLGAVLALAAIIGATVIIEVLLSERGRGGEVDSGDYIRERGRRERGINL